MMPFRQWKRTNSRFAFQVCVECVRAGNLLCSWKSLIRNCRLSRNSRSISSQRIYFDRMQPNSAWMLQFDDSDPVGYYTETIKHIYRFNASEQKPLLQIYSTYKRTHSNINYIDINLSSFFTSTINFLFELPPFLYILHFQCVGFHVMAVNILEEGHSNSHLK